MRGGFTVQVKRPRNEDPLQALIFQGTKRKRDQDDDCLAYNGKTEVMFRLAETFDTEQKHVILQKINEGTHSSSKLKIAPSKRSKPNDPDDGQLPEQLRSMISEYISPSERKQSLPDITEIDKETEDYVYDVYYTEKVGPSTDDNIGYIELNDEESKLVFRQIDSDDDDEYAPDDEDDSNAEDYYKNDYPDEDIDDIYSPYGSDNDSVDKFLGEDVGDLEIDQTAWSEDEDDNEYSHYGWKR